MSSLTMSCDLVHPGMATPRDSIVVGILRSDEQVPDIDRAFWRRGVGAAVLIGRCDNVGALRALTMAL
jgi:hypothetical protein